MGSNVPAAVRDRLSRKATANRKCDFASAFRARQNPGVPILDAIHSPAAEIQHLPCSSWLELSRNSLPCTFMRGCALFAEPVYPK